MMVIIRICMDCNKFLNAEVCESNESLRIVADPTGSYAISHGVCLDCVRERQEELAPTMRCEICGEDHADGIRTGKYMCIGCMVKLDKNEGLAR